MTPVAWMCSGQGSQYFGMARDLYRDEPVFRRAFALCAEIVQPLIGARLDDIVYAEQASPYAPFDRVLHSSPAIVSVQYALARVLRARGQAPDLVIGYSLGEISAGVLAGALTLEDGLRLSVRMAQVLEEGAPAGAMLAVLGAADLLAQHPGWFAGTELAGLNFDGHFVLSGPPAAIAQCEAALAAHEVATQRLPVRFAFHSSLIEPVAPALRALLEGVAFAPAAIDMLSASDGRISRTLSGASLWTTLRATVDFRAALARMAALGPRRYVDLGPAGTLATFAKYGLPTGTGAEIVTTVTPFGDGARALARLAAPAHREQAWT